MESKFECRIDNELEATFIIEEIEDDEVKEELQKLEIGQEVRFGGGAAPVFDYKRIA
jgi:hypothetical protein